MSLVNLLDHLDEKIAHKLDHLEEKYGYLAYIDNWHKYPKLSKIMCRLGRHDYEYLQTFWKVEKPGGHSRIAGAVLECFYCYHQKRSG